MDAQDEQNLLRGQKNYLEIEVRKFRRKKLLSYHIFELELLREVSMPLIIRVFYSLESYPLCFPFMDENEKDGWTLFIRARYFFFSCHPFGTSFENKISLSLKKIFKSTLNDQKNKNLHFRPQII